MYAAGLQSYVHPFQVRYPTPHPTFNLRDHVGSWFLTRHSGNVRTGRSFNIPIVTLQYFENIKEQTFRFQHYLSLILVFLFGSLFQSRIPVVTKCREPNVPENTV